MELFNWRKLAINSDCPEGIFEGIDFPENSISGIAFTGFTPGGIFTVMVSLRITTATGWGVGNKKEYISFSEEREIVFFLQAIKKHRQGSL